MRSNRGIVIKTGFLLLCCTFFLYSYLVKQNELTKMKMELPTLAKSIKDLKEENKQLIYELEQMENPCRLMELVRSSEFSHLKHPFVKDILTIPEGVALQEHRIGEKWPYSSSLSEGEK